MRHNNYMIRKAFVVCSLCLLLAAAVCAGTRRGEYALLLKDPPLAEKVASRSQLRSAAARSHLARIQTAQRAVLAALSARKFHVTGAVQTLLNAVFVDAAPDRLAELRSIPGVARVAYVPPIHKSLNTALDLVNASAAWAAVGGTDAAGTGVKIAIIDTGIDQTHPAFQDPSLQPPDGFPKGDPAYTNGKVIVARSYVAQLAGTDPATDRPDDITPRDRSGHGTAIAMIAAGAQNTGPAATITGVAPKAWLGNYKIFGSPGVNDTTFGSVMVTALEDAVNDGMDIATLSVGDPAVYGPLDRDPSCGDGTTPADCDVRARAVENAIAQNLTVVVPAGNDGTSGIQVPSLATIDTPGSAPSAITVGATTNAHVFYSTVLASGQSFDALFGDGPRGGAVSAPLADVAQTGNDGLACTVLPSGSLARAVALIQRGTCTFTNKVLNARNAGAVGVIIYNSGSDTPIAPLGVTGAAIPVVMVGASAGGALKSLAQQNPQVTVDPTLHAVPDAPNVVADFSSRGPNIGNGGIKPELVAPGRGIYSATQSLDSNSELYSPDRYTAATGASFAVPMAAGAAALVKQRNAALSPGQIKSALVNTANADVQDGGGQARAAAAGAGRLDAAAAVNAGATAEPATLGFGVLNAGSLPIGLALKITNTGSASATFNLAVAALNDSSARLTVYPASLPLDPNQSGTVEVQLAGTMPGPGSYEGAVTVTGGGTSLRVPYLYLVGNGVAANILPIINGAFTGVVNDPYYWLIGFKLVDRYGVPVTNTPVQFNVASGGGSISAADPNTDRLGIAAADVFLGPTLGDQVFTATAGGLTVEFDGFARQYPTISTNGVINGASGTVGRGLAPGSHISIYGSGLGDSLVAASTPSLPLSLAGVSVSFDAPGVSVPGRLYLVSSSQVDVQIPWELAGQTSASMKVSIGNISSAVYTVPLADYSPAAFETTDGTGRRLALAMHRDYSLVTPSKPAVQGEVIQIFANGLGPVSPQPASGEPGPAAEPLSRSTNSPTATIGGIAAPVGFSGLTPNQVGVYQVNVTVPADAPSGVQPLVISVGGIDSKPSNLPVQ